jgi:signal transduction histidine kinase
MVVSAINENRLIRVLAGGFLLVIVLLLVAAFLDITLIQSIRSRVARLVEDQLVTTALVDEVQREQNAFSAVFYDLAGDGDSLNRGRVLSQVNSIESHIRRVVSIGRQKTVGRSDLWIDLQNASIAFAAEARRLLGMAGSGSLSSRELFRRHEQVLAAVAQLIRASHDQASQTRSQIETESRRLIRQSTLLLGACLALSSVCAVLILRIATTLVHKITAQAEELARVSWHLLQNQEVLARRLSHEMHDELGQLLTALKTNFARHATLQCADPEWLADCNQLLKDSIRSVHEISLLLRPTILDDFGLPSALRWLCERFEERSGIEVHYECSLAGRLSDDSETHLFRIAQEALTNVARHAGATAVQVRLWQEGDRVKLHVRDNGRGLPASAGVARQGLGLVGMRARARSAGGELTVHSSVGQGVLVEASIPLEVLGHEQEDPHLVG